MRLGTNPVLIDKLVALAAILGRTEGERERFRAERDQALEVLGQHEERVQAVAQRAARQ
jgi:hypothetical protein